MDDPRVMWQYAQMVADATPEFYIEHLRRCARTALMHISRWACSLTRDRGTADPRRALHGPNERVFQHGRRRHRGIQSVRFDGAHPSRTAWIGVHLSIHVPAGLPHLHHVHRAGPAHSARHRGEPVGTGPGQAIHDRPDDQQNGAIAEELGRPIATPEETRQILKLGTWYDSPTRRCSTLGCLPSARKANAASSPMRPMRGGFTHRWKRPQIPEPFSQPHPPTAPTAASMTTCAQLVSASVGSG